MHSVDSRGTRHSLLAAGFVASLFALVGSAVLNWRYGHALARTPEDGMIFGILAIASDVFMAVSLFYFFEARRNKQYAMMAASILVWAATTAFAGVAAVSQASMNRIDAVAHRAAASTSYADTRTELTEARKLRDKIGVWPKTETTARTDIEKHKTNRLWTQSSECQEISGKAQREYCATYQTLVGELATAQQVAKLDKRIEDLVTKSDTAIANNVSVTSEADPAAATIAGATGYSQRGVQTTIIMGFAGLMLILCSLGPFITSSMLAAHDNPKIITLEAETVPPAPTDAIKLEAVKPLALPKPAEVAPTVAARPEPSAEWRALLDAIDFPRKRPGIREPKRPKDDRDYVLGLRWLVWLGSYDRTGKFTSDELDRLYEEYVAADGREPWGANIAKAKLHTMGSRWVAKQDSQPPTTWAVERPKASKVRALLLKHQRALEQSGCWKGFEGNEPKGATETTEATSSVVPFPARFWGRLAGGRAG